MDDLYDAVPPTLDQTLARDVIDALAEQDVLSTVVGDKLLGWWVLERGGGRGGGGPGHMGGLTRAYGCVGERKCREATAGLAPPLSSRA